MPQFDQNANFNSLMDLGAGAPATQGQPNNTYVPQTPGAQEDYEIISLLNPQANQSGQGNGTPGTQDFNNLQQQVSTLASGLQQSIALQREAVQRDLEWRQEQQRQDQQRRLEEQQRAATQTAQQQREQLLNNLIPQIDENNITLTPEEQQKFGTSADFVRKVATQAQRDILNQMAPGLRRIAEDQLTLRQTVDQLRNTNTSSTLSAQQQQDLIIQAQVPNASQLVADPRFAQFKQQQSAVPGFTNGDLIDLAYRNGRAPAVIEHLKQFQNVISGKQPPVNVQGQQGQPIQTPQRVTKLRRSEYDQAVERFQLGQMDEATFNRIDAEFQTALVEGRVADL